MALSLTKCRRSLPDMSKNQGIQQNGMTKISMGFTAPNELIWPSRSEFLRDSTEGLQPFDLSEDDKDYEPVSGIVKDRKLWMSLSNCWSLFEDAFAIICCTKAGPNTVAAVTVRWTKDE